MTQLLRKMLLLIIFISVSLIYFSRTLSTANPPTLRRLASDNDNKYYIDSLNEFPPLLFTHQQLKYWGWTLCFVGMIYCIVGIAIICDDYFVPAVELIADRFNMSEDIAGATWLAIGTSAPELFTCFIGTFVAQSDVGFGTIVGSAIFNVGLILGSCAIFSGGDLKIAWWPFTRDMLYLLLSLGTLALFFGVISKNEIYWWESLILILLYVTYVLLMKYNEEIKTWFFNKYIHTEKQKQLLSKQTDYGTSSTDSDPQMVTDVIVPFTPFDTYKTPSFKPRTPSIVPFTPSPVHYLKNDQMPTYQMLQKDTISKDKMGVMELSTPVSIKGTGDGRGDYFIRELSYANIIGGDYEKGVDLSFPLGTWKRIWYIIQAPLKWSIHFTLFDVTKESNESWWPWTFILCILWLGGLSYLMVWWCVAVGYAWLVPQQIMGLVFLAFGTSLPELITCVIVAKIGKADMAIAGAIASNILNILIGLPLPWLSMSIITNISGNGDLKMDVQASGLFVSILVLILMMATISLLIVINKWILTHCIGWAMIALYIVFVAQDLVRYYFLKM